MDGGLCSSILSNTGSCYPSSVRERESPRYMTFGTSCKEFSGQFESLVHCFFRFQHFAFAVLVFQFIPLCSAHCVAMAIIDCNPCGDFAVNSTFPTPRFTSALIQVSFTSVQCRRNFPRSGQSQTGESAVFCLKSTSTSSSSTPLCSVYQCSLCATLSLDKYS